MIIRGIGLLTSLSLQDLKPAFSSVLSETQIQTSSSGKIHLPVGQEVAQISKEASDFFLNAVMEIQNGLDLNFMARLAIYGVSTRLPSGIPGDPARDYSRGTKTRCGKFLSGSDQPYSICPTTYEVTHDIVNDQQRQCCRHFAYCVPYSLPGFAVEDRVSTVMVSERLFRLPEKTWRAILAHELGHAIDFWTFGGRYRLRNHSPSRGMPLELENQLADISDPEFRADILGEYFVLKPHDQRLCYSPVSNLQQTVGLNVSCQGDGSTSQLMRHFSHPPIQGKP